MDTETELRAERDTLAKADFDIQQGEGRLSRQNALIAELTDTGQDLQQAEQLLRLLQATLVGWRLHRQLIVERIAHLERRSSLA